MPDERVVHFDRLTCPSCGNASPGYAQAFPDGTAQATCDRCGATIVVQLPKEYVAQVPPRNFVYPMHPHVQVTHYPGLYMQPKHAPRLDFTDLVKVAYSPARAFSSLYLSTNMQRALSIVILFSALSTVVSMLVTADMGDILGYSRGDVLALVHEGFVSWVVSLLAFLVFSVTAAVVAKGVFGGRGERSATITLVGYAYPAYVLLSIVLLLIFTTGFRGLDPTDVHDWSDVEMNQALAAGAVLILVAFVGLAWLLWIAGKAISVANDISTGEAVLTAMLAAISAGVVYVFVGLVMRLPMGLFL